VKLSIGLFWHISETLRLLQRVAIKCSVSKKTNIWSGPTNRLTYVLDSAAIFSVFFGFVGSSIIRRRHYIPLPFASPFFLRAEVFVSQTVWYRIRMSPSVARTHVARIYKLLPPGLVLNISSHTFCQLNINSILVRNMYYTRIIIKTHISVQFASHIIIIYLIKYFMYYNLNYTVN
jgi:hypothetical protein